MGKFLGKTPIQIIKRIIYYTCVGLQAHIDINLGLSTILGNIQGSIKSQPVRPHNMWRFFDNYYLLTKLAFRTVEY